MMFLEQTEPEKDYYVIDFPSESAISRLEKTENKAYLDILISDDIGELLIDNETDKLIGYVFVNNAEDKGFIFNLVVLPEFRGMGYSHILVEDAIHKFGGIDLVVKEDNQIAIDLYLKHGFDFVAADTEDGELYMKLVDEE